MLDDWHNEFIKDDDKEYLFPEKKILHPNIKKFFESKNFNGFYIEEPFNLNASGLSPAYVKLLELKARQQDIDFFKSFYLNEVKKLKDRKYSPQSINNLRKHEFILTSKFKLVDSHSARLNLDNLEIISDLEENLNIVHPDLLKSNEILFHFENYFEIPRFSNSDVFKFLKSEEFPHLEDSWALLSSKQKLKKILYLFDLFKNENLENNDLIHLSSFLTLESEENSQCSPDKLFFSEAYGNQFILSRIIQKFDHEIRVLSSQETSAITEIPSIDFLSDKYYRKVNPNEIDLLRNFLEQLGVNHLLNDNNFKRNLAEEIGILSTCFIEHKSNRKCTDLSRNKEGYDVESFDKKRVKKIIEAKGSLRSNPEITITAREYNTLLATTNSFIYILTDALNNPKLKVIKAQDMKKLNNWDLRFSFGEWTSVISEDYDILEE